MNTAELPHTTWLAVCNFSDLEPERGVAALVQGDQVAIFRLVDGSVVAVQHLDPVSGAHVLARGIVGSRGERVTVASPVYKQVYDLRTGECLEAMGAQAHTLRRWQTQVRDGVVHVASAFSADLVPAPERPHDAV